MEIVELLRKAVSMRGSDIFIVPGAAVTVKVNDEYSYQAVIRKIEEADNDNADPIRQY